MFCAHCGQEIDNNAVICPHCGVPTKNMQQPSYGNQTNAYPNRKVNGLGIAGFVLSLVGMLGGNYLFLMPGLVGLILSIIGMVNRKNCTSCNGLAIAGLVISIISLAFWIFVWIIAIGLIVSGEVPIY